MAGHRHQFILGLVVRQMRLYGCKVYYVDGKNIALASQSPPTPPTVLRHRPDAMGVTDSGQVCIGDAKISSDITSKRTTEQLLDFSSVELNGLPCEVFIGIPSDVSDQFANTLHRIGLDANEHLHVLRVPAGIING